MKRTLIRRIEKDTSQTLRRLFQVGFLLLNLWLGIQFALFVMRFEGRAVPVVSRPPGVEGWLPIAGMMNTRLWLLTGEVPVIHPAAMFLFLAFLTASILFRKAFCGWLCPVGTISEYLWKLGRNTFRRNFALPKWLDIPLRGLKYILLGLFLYAVVSMSAPALAEFLKSPYGLIADVKMLDFFRKLSVTAAIIVALLIVASVFVKNFWCRYLCPYGALMGLASVFSPARITRNPETCIDCSRCAKACPANLAVDKLIQIRSAECIGCLECVAVCPAEGALEMKLAPVRRRLEPRVLAMGVAVLVFGTIAAAKLTGHWDSPIPDFIYERLIPVARELSHP